MKKLLLILILIMLAVTLTIAGTKENQVNERGQIKKIIEEGFIKGLLIEGDITAIRKGFDVDFVKLTLQKNHMHKHPLNWIIEGIKKKREEKKVPVNHKITFKIPMIDVDGNAAVAKVEIYKNAKLTASHYLSLYKFDEEFWQIVNMICQEH